MGANVDEFVIVDIPECYKSLDSKEKAMLSILKEGTVLSAGMLKAAIESGVVVPGTVLKDEWVEGHVMVYRRKSGKFDLARVYKNEKGIWLIDEDRPWATELLAAV